MNTQKPAGYFSTERTDLSAFRALTEDVCTPQDVPLADNIIENVPIYDMPAQNIDTRNARRALMSEWAEVLLNGPGVLALRAAYADTRPIDAASAVFDDILAEETAAGGGADHFAAAGSNARIWNVVEKLCLRAPDIFAAYFGNTAIATMCEAWLGPGYQMTAQVNLVKPGGAAQTCHRDYHLGFMSPEQAAQYPAHVHRLSPALTLQGAVAHCDMPLISGPTKLLPFSQRYDAGYLAYSNPDFQAYFDDHFVQLPLKKGDALFFNPALFHAAGANTSKDIFRLANLLQISSPMGIAMEAMDRHKMCNALYPALQTAPLPVQNAHAAIAACAEGYAFPTSLDRDPPVDGLAPETQADILKRALEENWDPSEVADALEERRQKRWG